MIFGERSRFLTYLVLSLIISGCVLKYPVPRNSRFAVDISKMRKVEASHETWIYQHPSKRVKDYPAFFLESVEVFPKPVRKLSPVSRDRYNGLAQNLRTRLESKIQSGSQSSQQPGAKALDFKVAIIDLKPIVSLKKNGNDVVVVDPQSKGTKFELDAIDSKTGELIFAISTLYKGEEYTDYENPSLTSLLEEEWIEWVEFLGDQLKEKRL